MGRPNVDGDTLRSLRSLACEARGSVLARGSVARGSVARGSGAGFRVGTKSINRHLKSASVFLDVVKRCLSFISSILSLPDSPGVRFYDVALDFS